MSQQNSSSPCDNYDATVRAVNGSMRLYTTGGGRGAATLSYTRGGGSSSSSGVTSKSYYDHANYITCKQAIDNFAAKPPCTYSDTLLVIVALISVLHSNNNAGATDAEVFAAVQTLCPTTTLSQPSTEALITAQATKGVFRLFNADAPPRLVNLDINFGYYPQNRALYVEMGNTPYYMFCLGLLCVS